MSLLHLTLVTGLLPQRPPQICRRDALTGAAAAAAAAAAPASLVFAPGRAEAAVEAAASTTASAAASVAASASKRVPRIGIGAWAWGDSLFWQYDPAKDEELREVFDFTVDQGVKLVDTAEVYGFGRSEALIGKFANANPKAKDIEVATKFAALPWRTKASDVVEAAKKSTDRLGRPIGLYQIHFPNAWANAAYWDGLADCVDQGLVKAVGVSNYGVDAMRACNGRLQERGVKLASNQIQLSLLYPYALENGLMSACNELDVEVLAYSPLGLGMLTGKFSESYLPSGPRKLIAQKYVSDPAFNELIGTMRSVAAEVGGPTNPAQVALGWCMAKGASVIPGARNLRQVESNLRPRDFKLSAAQVARLDEVAARVPKAVAPEANPFPKKDVFSGLTMYDS